MGIVSHRALFHFCLFFFASSWDCAAKYTGATFRGQENRALENHVMESMEARSLVDCAAICVGTENCASVNYETATRTCEINASPGSETVITREGWDHYAVIMEPTTTPKSPTTTQPTTAEQPTTTPQLSTTTEQPTTSPQPTTAEQPTTTPQLPTTSEQPTTLTNAPAGTTQAQAPGGVIHICGTFEYEANVVQTPGYPDATPNGLSCDQLFKAPVGRRVYIAVEDIGMYASTNWAGTPQCDDKWKFHDGDVSDSGNLILKVCGSEPTLATPAYFLSSGQWYLGRLVTGITGTSRGIRYSVKFIKDLCGSTIEVPAGGQKTFTSPGFGIGNLPNDVQCDITVTAPSSLRLTFPSFNLDCSGDTLLVFDGPSDASLQLGSLCGFNDGVYYTATGNTLFLRLSTDGSTYSEGFEATAQEVP